MLFSHSHAPAWECIRGISMTKFKCQTKKHHLEPVGKRGGLCTFATLRETWFFARSALFFIRGDLRKSVANKNPFRVPTQAHGNQRTMHYPTLTFMCFMPGNIHQPMFLRYSTGPDTSPKDF